MEIVTENPVTLAWIGDAVYTLAVRHHLFDKGMRKADLLQKTSARFNGASGQAAVLDLLVERGLLNEDELEIVRRGRNAHVKSPSKSADLKTYLKATALEALFGYLDLYHHHQRRDELLKIWMDLQEELL